MRKLQKAFLFLLIFLFIFMEAATVETYLQMGYNKLGQRTDSQSSNSMVNPAQLVTSDLTAVKAQQQLRNPILNDWTEVTKISLSGNNIFNFGGGVALQKGDKIRITYSDNSYAYGYIGSVTTTTQAIIYANSTLFSAGSNNVSKIHYSRLTNPAGHPVVLSSTIVLISPTTTPSVITGAGTYYWYMTGPVMHVSTSGNPTIVSGAISYMGYELPFIYPDISSSYPTVIGNTATSFTTLDISEGPAFLTKDTTYSATSRPNIQYPAGAAIDGVPFTLYYSETQFVLNN